MDNLEPDELGTKLSEHEGGLVALRGHIARHPHNQGYWRLYLSPDGMRYVDVRENDIVRHEKLNGDQYPLGGTVLWISPDAEVRHVTSRQVRASFLAGPIASAQKGQSVTVTLAPTGRPVEDVTCGGSGTHAEGQA